jgi:hypothetical protein
MRWTGYVARMWRREMHIGFYWERQKKRDHWGDPDLGRKILLNESERDGMGWYALD